MRIRVGLDYGADKKMERVTLDMPLTEADFDAHGNPDKEALERATAVVESQVQALFDTSVRLGVTEKYIDDEGKTRYRRLRELTPDEELEVDRAMNAAIGL
jgi:hypothetical protein